MKGGDAPPPPFESARGLPSPQGRARDFFRRIADGSEFAPTLAARAPSPRSSRGEGWGEGLFRHHRSCGESPSPGSQERSDLSPHAAIECTHLVACSLEG